ncbi:MAG: hypothetical protein JRJ29_16330 [Deltaproteobacteria bacterium]|nr:hypothetical protein [Deltaproteobacteria bacterium]
MPGPRPKNVTVEFEDGSRVTVPFDELPLQLQQEITRQPFASKPSTNPGEERFLILEWDDGWKEVFEVNPACTGINRYYVISRPEDVGRLSLNKEDGYPELIEIIRNPLNIKRITFSETFRLEKDRSTREGKKVDHFFKLSREGDSLSRLMDDFKKSLADEGVDPDDLTTDDQARRKDLYEKIRRRMGIRAGFRQQDVYDFLTYLAMLARQ